MMTDEQLIRAAHQAGTDWANGLQPGSTFLGASPKAKELFPQNRLFRALFVNAALDILQKKTLCTDGNGVIVRCD